MPSDDERSEKKFTYDGGDWRRLMSRARSERRRQTRGQATDH